MKVYAVEMKVYAVVMRMTETDDDVEIFPTKRRAREFVKTKLQEYINAAYINALLHKRDVEHMAKTIDDIDSYKEANGNGYCAYFPSAVGNYVHTARIVEKEI